jgi:hypothetical protein
VPVWVLYLDDDDCLSEANTQKAAGNPCGFFYVQEVRYATVAWMRKNGDA